ncbi:MAG TPA: 2-C-methyl-D-erythritol 4-phosphate cytidylyltransferase [Pyrinomonadaceae bacterium]|nr:2-C-methyl-D-erythritol 4-phosphate cytidylyltransferase [Pyrinomonadaceae bacterium]
MNTAIIVAAGTGSRFNSEIPKQFLDISGRPVIIHTLERFQSCEAVDEIVVVMSPERSEKFLEENLRDRFSKLKQIVDGGNTRAKSVRNGLAAVCATSRVVAVHDGARPLVSTDEIRLTIERAAEVGAACLVAPVLDTMKHVEGGFITGTVDRDRLRRALTPQAFRHEILTEAFRDADLSETVTDECYLVEKLRVPIAVVEGSPRNIKITHPRDFALAEFYLGQEQLS